MGESFYEMARRFMQSAACCFEGAGDCGPACDCKRRAQSLANEAQMMMNEQVSEVEAMNSALLGELDDLRIALNSTRVAMDQQVRDLYYSRARALEQTREHYEEKIRRMFATPEHPPMLTPQGDYGDYHS